MNELAEQKNLELVGKRVRRISDEAYARFLKKIKENELASVVTEEIVLGYFANEFYKLLRDEFKKALYESLGDLKIQDYPVGRIKISDKLFHHAHSTSLIVRRIVQQHANDFQIARNLALQLFEGYDFKDDPLKIKKQLPKYLTRPLARLQAKRLKTPALKAAYLQLIDKIEQGAGFDALEKVLRIAFYERNRYFANRIAQTELHRSYTDKRARELMADADVEYIQLRLSKKHPNTDICDLYAKMDKYGLGPGVYPKDSAPKPPFHPHCLCDAVPRIDIFDKTPKEKQNAESAFIRSKTKADGAAIAGSFAKRKRVLDGENIIDIQNDGKDPLYHLKLIGEFDEQ